MIIVEIKVPALDKTYDFQLEENVPLKDVRREIGEIIEELGIDWAEIK